MTNIPLFHTLQDASKILNVNIRTLKKMIIAEQIQTVPLGKRQVVPQKSIENYLSQFL